jgi:hypothetical protein
MAARYADTPKNTIGNGIRHLHILAEEIEREQETLTELAPEQPRLTRKEKFGFAIARHPRLSRGQKEQALYFLFHPLYPDAIAIAQNYVKLCLNPKYTARGTAWRCSDINKKSFLPFV